MDKNPLNIFCGTGIDIGVITSLLSSNDGPFEFSLVSHDSNLQKQTDLLIEVDNEPGEELTACDDGGTHQSVRISIPDIIENKLSFAEAHCDETLLPALIKQGERLLAARRSAPVGTAGQFPLLATLNQHSMLLVTNNNGIITAASTKFCLFLEYEAHELIGQHISIVSKQGRGIDFIENAPTKSDQQISLQSLFTKSNNRRWAKCLFFSEYGNGIDASKFIFAYTDVTDIEDRRDQAEQINKKLKEYEIILQTLLANNNLVEMQPKESIREVLGIGIAFLSIDHVRLWVSSHREHYFFCCAELLADKNEYRWFEETNSLHLAVDKIPQQLKTCNNPQQFEKLPRNLETILREDRLNSVIFYPIYYRGQLVAALQCGKFEQADWNAEVIQFTKSWSSYIAMLLDVQRKISIRDKLIKRETTLNPNNTLSRIGHWEMDFTTDQRSCNKYACSLFGLKDSANFSLDSVNAVTHQDDRDKFKTALKEAINKNGELDLEHRVVWQDGTVRWLHQVGNVLHGPDGNFLRVQAAIIDITYRVTYQQELIHSRQQALHGNKIKTEFFARINHELKTPLNAILGFAQVINRKFDEGNFEHIKEYVMEIIAGGNHLQRIVGEVIDLARLENGTFQLAIGPVELDTVFAEVESSMAPIFSTSQVKLIYNKNKIKGRVIGDPVRIKQVLINFLSNTSKYCPEGSAVKFGYTKTEKGLYRLYVEDNGPGIPQEIRNQLFEPFHRGREHLNTEGSGVGLTISKELAELMNGTIGFTSEPSKGTCIWIDLIKAKRSQSILQSESAAPIQPLSFGKTKSNTNKQVLYIDDNEDNIFLVEDLLEKYETTLTLQCTSQPLQGIELATNNNFDLIMLDINMPKMSGYEVLKSLRGMPHLNDTPIIAVTAYYADHDSRRCISAGFSDFVAKPIDVQMFYSKVENHLGITQQGAP